MSMFDIFSASQETLEEAKDKRKKEQSTKVDRMRFDKEGTYSIRVLPLAPILTEDGTILPMDRKGYEYPARELLLKISTGQNEKGEEKFAYQSVCHTSSVFPDFKNDLIDLYLRLACEKYASNEKLCKKLRSNSFSGGIKYDSKRYVYVLDLAHRSDGIKLLGLSYSQYKDLEERKLTLWAKLRQKDPGAQCPVCSPLDAYPVEVTRKKENGKTEYSLNIDLVEGTQPLTEEELAQLFEAPRLPEVLYKYRRVHLEATVAFLKQVDEHYKIDVMHEPQIQECIDQISLLLPADDQTHWNSEGKSADAEESQSIDMLWETLQNIIDAGEDDHCEAGQELRTAIREYIDAHNYDIKITRKKTNEMLLQEIDDLETEGSDEDEGVPAESEAPVEDSYEDEDETPAAEPEEDPEPAASAPVQRQRNDDTNEPAARTERRLNRPARRRGL